MTIVSKNLGGHGPIRPPWLRLWHWGTLARWIWPRLLSKHFMNLLNPQPHVVFFRLLNTKIEKSLFKNNKKARSFKLLSKVSFYRQSAAPQKVPPAAPRAPPLLRHCLRAIVTSHTDAVYTFKMMYCTGWPKKMCTHENFNCDFD